jgi:imidazolonepropionase-like amidohydrolase
MFLALLVAFGASIVTSVDSTTYPVLNHGRAAGEMVVLRYGISPSDSVVVRYRYIDRNRGQRSETRYRFAANGDVTAAEVRPLTLDGKPAGTPFGFEFVGDSIKWNMPAQAGRAAQAGPNAQATPPLPKKVEAGVFYNIGFTPYDEWLLARFLLRQPRQSGRLYRAGAARLEFVVDTSISTRAGRERVRFAVLHGFGEPTAPAGIWLDARNDLVATEVEWFISVKPGREAGLPALRAAEIRYRNAQAEALSRSLTRPAASAIVIRDGDVFDSERATIRPHTSVLIRGDRIVAVGPTDSITTPAGATVIEATGKTVMPGMADMHTHFGLLSQLSSAVSELAGGITTIRDMASDADIAVSHRDRAQAGTLVSPRAILAGFLEGPGAWAGPSGVLVRTEAEAREWIARYDSLGYKQIKLYNLVHPDLVPTIAAEAHRRGMRLSGHIPRGLTVPAAVLLGFDEIQHGAFLFSTFFQDSLYVPTMRAYSAVASIVAPNVNVDGPEMTGLVEFLRQHHTVIDGTFNIWQGGATGAIGVSSSNAAGAAYGKLVKKLYDAGVTLVPGTDANTVPAYLTELQLYEQDGIPAPKVLQIATLVPAQVMREDKDYGSIAPGKVADIAIVNGKPAEHVSDLKNVEQVIRAGRLYKSAELLTALRGPATATP